MASTNRQYDLIVFGATGYTGKLTAEHITTHLPTDLKWALAGRSKDKLEAIVEECQSLNPDRLKPAIEICQLNSSDLKALAKKTTVLISAVGPYCIHGEHAFQACAENGTHYLDVTGEIPWVASMIKKHEASAKASGAIMIPQIGVESAPADLITWSVVDMIREKFGASTGEVVVSLHEMSAKPSGGTLATILSLLDVFSLRELAAANTPYAISPIPGPKTQSSVPILTRVKTLIFGTRSVRDLGILTTSLAGSTDAAIVHRSWGQLGGPSGYGPNFQFHEYMKARNYFTAIAIHYALIIGAGLLTIPFLRTVAKKFVYQPGDGPTKEESRNDRVEYRSIGHPDSDGAGVGKRVFVKARFEGSLYLLTGTFLAQAALSILKDDHKTLTGGIYTPASLGQPFIDRLQDAGFKFERKVFED